MRLSRLRDTWRSQGTLGSLQSARDRWMGTRSSLARQAQTVTAGARALEVGGPSRHFRRRGMLPLYASMRTVDNINFSRRTLWSDGLRDGGPYAPEGVPVGIQLLREATDLRDIPDHYYDVVLSSHCLEHIANPLRALQEWRRICRPSGHLCLVVPHRDRTFDWHRPVTSIEHLRSDALNNVEEDDDTHFEEVLRYHDLRRDPGARSAMEFQRRVADNWAIRGVHHHVFDLRTAVLLVSEAGWTPVAAEARRPHDILILGQSSTNTPAEYEPKVVFRGSPFRSDRRAPGVMFRK